MAPAFHDFAATVRLEDIPEDVRSVLRRSLLDTLGVAAIGSTTQMAAIARNGAAALFGQGTAGAARVLLSGMRLSPAGAAMAGAFTVDSIDAHDGSSPCKGHAGSAVIPALLACADIKKTMQGSELSTLLALGYEIS
ncbi:MAG: MmgE/PrpD family protein, partial [Roseobacter sp.]|nr:MmgE/PrpD family protein [Roseobacter sp.]